MTASQAHERNGPKKSPWTPKEDQKLIRYMKKYGEPRQWTKVPKLARLNRCGKSCRLRWLKYLRPDIKRGNFSQDEEDTIIKLQSVHGNRWALIATQLPGRTDTEIKNHWNTRLKKLAKKDIPPATQTPLLQPLLTAAVFLGSCANYLRDYALKLHSDARVPNPRLHGVGFISTHPAGALPGQGSGFNYQAMRDATVYNPPDQFDPLITSILNTGGLIPFPQVEQNYAAHIGSLFGNIPPATQTPMQPLLAVAGWLASTAAYLRSYALGLHSDAQLPNLHSLHNPVVQPGFGDVTPDPQAQLAGLGFISTDPAQTLSSIPSQAPGFNYDGFDFNSTDPAQTLPRHHNYPDEHGSLFANIPTERSVPAVLVSDSTERSRANQVVENEVTPAEESTKAFLKLCRRELLMDDETSESFGGDFSPYAVNSKIAEFLSVIADNPNASSIPAPVSGSPEPSMANQVVEKITPAGQEIPNSFWGDVDPVLFEMMLSETHFCMK